MTDIFISYSKTRRDVALNLANKLEELGYVVWWDTSLVPQGSYRDEIDLQLDTAKAVIVIWSPESIKSSWVRSEADHADGQAKLVNTFTIDLTNPGKQIPKPFNQTHAVLTDELSAITRALDLLQVNRFKGDNLADTVKQSSVIPKTAQYTGPARIQLPFYGVSLRILHDDMAYILGGSKGELAAFDSVTGELLDQVKAENPSGRPGRGEKGYVGDVFYFLELGDDKNIFYTMSDQGNLKTWTFDGKLQLLNNVDLLGPHALKLISAIENVRRSGNWSSWTCYNSGDAEQSNIQIVEAKLSPNKKYILCLTDWFAVYRCDLSGQLLDEVIVVPDGFNIEPANDDASEFWIGESRSVSPKKLLIRYSFTNGRLQTAIPSMSYFGAHGIFKLGDQALLAGGALLDQRDLTKIDGELSLMSGHEPTVVEDKGMVLAPMASMIYIYDFHSLKKTGNPMVAGHEGYVNRVEVTHDRTRAVSISENSLCVWDLNQRRPMQEETQGNQETLIHNTIGNFFGYAFTLNNTALFPGYDQQVALINFDQNKALRCSISDDARPIGLSGDDILEEARVVALSHSPVKHTLKAPGILGMVLKREVNTEQYYLKQYRVLSNSLIREHETNLGGPNERLGSGCIPSTDNTSAVDLGQGRIAILTAGHLLIYSTQQKSILKGPIDVSGPSSENEGGGSWTFYTQLALTQDRSRLVIRGKYLPIKIYDFSNLSLISTIFDEVGRLGLLLPWSDSRYLLFTSNNKILLADMMTNSVIGEVRDLNDRYVTDNPTESCLLGNGAYVAISAGQGINLYSLLDNEPPKKITLHSDGIGIIMPTKDGKGVITISSDGTAKKTDLDLPNTNIDQVTKRLVERAKNNTITAI